MSKKILAILMAITCCFTSALVGCAGEPGATGPQGPQGETGATGATGPAGAKGEDGRGIASMTINAEGHLIITYTDDATPVDLGKVVGSDGQDAFASNMWNGTETPADTFGVNGDYYMDTDDFLLYVKKDGVWEVLLEKFGGKDNTIYYNKNLFDYTNMGTTNVKTESGKAYVVEDWTKNLWGYMTSNGAGKYNEVSTTYFASHMMPVEPGKTYLYNIIATMIDKLGNTYNEIYCYDENYDYLGHNKGGEIRATIFDNNGTADVKDDDIMEFTVTDARTKYIRINIVDKSKGNFMLVEKNNVPGYEWPHKYLEYGEKVAIPGMEDVSGGGLTDTEKKLLQQSNPLYMKRVIWEGSSVMEGAGCAGGFAKMIAEENEMSSVNQGVSGGTIASGTGRHEISQGVIDACSANCDYIIFLGGSNDHDLGVELGEMTGLDNFTGPFDMNTVAGALESACKALATSGKKYGYVFYHKFQSSTSKWATVQRPLIINILEKWGCPYIDLETLCPPMGLIPELYQKYTKNGDRVHPNEAGYRLFYVDQITAWMKTL